MKKLKIGTVLIIIAAILFVIGMFMLDFDFYRMDPAEYTSIRQIVEVNEQKTLDIEFDNCQVNLVYMDIDEIIFDYYESNYSKFEYEEVGSKITIRRKQKSYFSLYFFDGIKPENRSVHIFLPNDLDINVDAKNAFVVIQNLQAKRIDIEVTNGLISLENVKATDLSLKGTNTIIKIEDTKVDTLCASTTNGAILASNFEVSNVIASVVNGQIEFEIVGDKNEFSRQITNINGFSNIKTELNSSLEKHLDLSVTNGNISVVFLKVST